MFSASLPRIAAELAVMSAAVASHAFAQDSSRYDGPIIDLHMHAYTGETFWGPAPHPVTGRSGPETAEWGAPSSSVGERIGSVASDEPLLHGLRAVMHPAPQPES